MEIKLFVSKNCPRCKILKSKLEEKGIGFETTTEPEEIIKQGFKAVPVLKVDKKYMNYVEAVKWINEYD